MADMPDTMRNAIEVSGEWMADGQITHEQHVENVKNIRAAHGRDAETGEESVMQGLSNKIESGLGAANKGLMSSVDMVKRGFAGAGDLGLSGPKPGDEAALRAAMPGAHAAPGSRWVSQDGMYDYYETADGGMVKQPRSDLSEPVATAQAAPESPTTLATPPPQPMPGQGPPRIQIPGVRAHTSGLRGLQDEIEGRQFEASNLQRQAHDNVRQATEEIGKTVLAAGAAEAEKLAEKAVIEGKRQETIEQQNKQLDELRVEHRGRVETQKAKIQEYKDSAKYFNLAPDEVKQYRDVLQDASSTDEQKTVAQAALAKGQQWDQIDTPREYIATALMALGAAMGAFGSAITKTPNHALQIVQRAAKDKIQRQKDEIARRKSMTAGEVNELDRLIAEFGDEVIAEKAMMARELSVFDATIDKLAAESGAENAQLNAQKIKAVLEQEAAALDADMESRIAAQEMQALGSRAAIEQQVAGQLQARDAGAQRAAIAQVGADARAARGKPIKESTVGKVAELQAGRDLVAKLSDDFGKKTGVFSFLSKYVPGTESKDYESARAAAVSAIVKALSGAAATDSERAYIASLIPSADTPDAQAGAMFEALSNLTELKEKRLVGGLGRSGYDVSGVAEPAPTAYRPAM